MTAEVAHSIAIELIQPASGSPLVYTVEATIEPPLPLNGFQQEQLGHLLSLDCFDYHEEGIDSVCSYFEEPPTFSDEPQATKVTMRWLEGIGGGTFEDVEEDLHYRLGYFIKLLGREVVL